MPRNLITIETDLGPKKFNSVHELSDWIESQLADWANQQKSLNSQRVNQIVASWNELNDTIVRILNDETTGQDQYEKSRNIVQRYFDEPKIICPSNPAIELAKETGNAHTIDAFFRALMNDAQAINLNDAHKIRGFIFGSIATGRYQQHLIPDLAKIRSTNQENLSELEDIKSEIRDLTKTQKNNNTEQAILIEDIEKRLDFVKKGFNESVNGLKGAFDDFVVRAEEKLNTIERTYKEHMSLRASVKYWSDQETHHKNWSIITLIILIVITSLTIGGIIFFGYISIDLASGTEIKLKDIPYAIALKAFIAALLLSFAVWAIKICNKSWHIHRHLKQDSRERVTMMKTYLALLSENNLKEKDIELILTSLFRPSYDGIIKDDTAPRSVFDFVLRESKT